MSTLSTASTWPVNSSKSVTSRVTGVLTSTSAGLGGGALGGARLQPAANSRGATATSSSGRMANDSVIGGRAGRPVGSPQTPFPSGRGAAILINGRAGGAGRSIGGIPRPHRHLTASRPPQPRGPAIPYDDRTTGGPHDEPPRLPRRLGGRR